MNKQVADCSEKPIDASHEFEDGYIFEQAEVKFNGQAQIEFPENTRLRVKLKVQGLSGYETVAEIDGFGELPIGPHSIRFMTNDLEMARRDYAATLRAIREGRYCVKISPHEMWLEIKR